MEAAQTFGTVNDHLEPMTLDEMREAVEQDKISADEVAEVARGELDSLKSYQMKSDITGKPVDRMEFNRFKRDQPRNLEEVARCPFFARFHALKKNRGVMEPITVFVTKTRDVGSRIIGDDWLLTNWTDRLGMKLRETSPGGEVCIELPKHEVTYKVTHSGQYEQLVPQLKNAHIRAIGRQGVVASEDDLVGTSTNEVQTTLDPVEYETKRDFGLDDIVVLADKPQQAAMGLPFDESLVIEGPPGSGKTSVGIMRIAVLYDQQWEALGLDQDRDRPFHDYNAMRILVYNEEMVGYLEKLKESIRVDVKVETTKEFFRKICRESKILSGRERRDPQSLTTAKSQKEAMRAYFAGFKTHAARYWSKHEYEVRRTLFDLGPDFLFLADTLRRWVERIEMAELVDDRIRGAIGIADDLTDTIVQIQRGDSPTRYTITADGDGQSRVFRGNRAIHNDAVKQAHTVIEEVVRGICDRVGITRCMFEQPEYAALMESLTTKGIQTRMVRAADRRWRRQYSSRIPGYSELDMAMTAWLGAHVLLSGSTRQTPWIGGRLERLTHVVVDEAQDLSPSHLSVLKSQLDAKGTMTLVGDVHQNLNPQTGLQKWEDTGLSASSRYPFAVNHRQTREMGQFVQGLYSPLFGDTCPWNASSKTVGRLPRIARAKSWEKLAGKVAKEARYWYEGIPGSTGATVAVLYDGVFEPSLLRWLREQLEDALSDLLVPVEEAMTSKHGEALKQTDRVVIASVHQTKGLEFDSVIFVESRPRWANPVEQIELNIRNAFYVAASRARAGLSVCMSNLPSCIEQLMEQGLCVSAPDDEEDIV